MYTFISSIDRVKKCCSGVEGAEIKRDDFYSRINVLLRPANGNVSVRAAVLFLSSNILPTGSADPFFPSRFNDYLLSMLNDENNKESSEHNAQYLLAVSREACFSSTCTKTMLFTLKLQAGRFNLSLFGQFTYLLAGCLKRVNIFLI